MTGGTDRVAPPESPSGYGEPYRVEYPTLLLLAGSMALGLAAAGAFGRLLWLVQGPAAFEPALAIEEGFIVTQDLVAFTIPFVAAIVVTVVVHEYLHGVAFRLNGYDVEYGVLVSKGAFFTVALAQYQRREDLFSVALAPLFLINAVAIGLLFVPVSMVALTGLFVLILNTAGAIGDLYITWRLWRMPPETMLYDVDIDHMYAFEPLPAE